MFGLIQIGVLLFSFIIEFIIKDFARVKSIFPLAPFSGHMKGRSRIVSLAGYGGARRSLLYQSDMFGEPELGVIRLSLAQT